MKHNKKIPKFIGLRIYLFSTILYFFLVMPIMGILFFKYGPEWLESKNITSSGKSHLSDSLLLNQDSLLFKKESYLSKQDSALMSKIKNLSNVDIDSLKIIDKEIISVFDTIAGIIDSINKQPDTAPLKITISSKTNSQTSENKFGSTLVLLLKVLALSFFIGLVFNLPFKIYFRKKRKGKKISERLFKFCKKLLLKSPIINSLILFLPYLVTLVYMAYILLFDTSFDDISKRFYIQFFFISLVASLLIALFVYFWEKHRVHIKYIEYIYSKEELRRRIFNIKVGKIKNRLWVSSGMTTLLPLTIVIFYLFLSLTTLKDIGVDKISDAQLKILFGKYLAYFSDATSKISFEDYQSFFYVNAFDSILMFIGIFTGIFISIIYILFFVNWTTKDIVGPVKELLANMQKTGQGELNQYSIVRTNDEIGELTEGFNEMSQKLKDYIANISRMNKANSRFVPRQFLDFLGKESIADIKLGDQVQKEMTILFSDIRSFTSISEEMTPKENFDFLNNYLGYMEPVIRNNHGFIDKFIGDSIMALFGDKAEDAINAAIEMRIKLLEFNNVMSQFGKPPIESGIGIHTGLLMLGIVGGEGRMDGTVISDAVNLSSRLEGLTKIYGGSIIISEDTLIKLNDPSQYNYRFLDIVKVKGKKEAVYIFEILDGEPEKIKQLKIKTKDLFSNALQLYKNGEFKKAEKYFKETYEIDKFDKAAAIYIERCNNLIKYGVPKNWDGIEVIEEK